MIIIAIIVTAVIVISMHVIILFVVITSNFIVAMITVVYGAMTRIVSIAITNHYSHDT